VTSDEDLVYNCIAHAAGKTDAWWWPEEHETEGVYWPAGVSREESLDSFVSAFGTLGYLPCTGTELEVAFEKVAIYANAQGKPTHAARQLPSGAWTSKLGEWEDIEHNTLADLEGVDPGYGKVAHVLKRFTGEQKTTE